MMFRSELKAGILLQIWGKLHFWSHVVDMTFNFHQHQIKRASCLTHEDFSLLSLKDDSYSFFRF